MADDARRILADGVRDLGLDLPAGASDLLFRHLDLVVDANRTTNLTRVTDEADMIRTHVLDALSLLAVLPAAGHQIAAGTPYLDIGTGAGFPGIPIAIVRPDLPVSLAESRGPKARFLADAVGALGLENVAVFPHRARELHHHVPVLARRFRLITARAVADLARVLREVKAVVSRGGLVVHFKGAGLDEEEMVVGGKAAEQYKFETLPTIDSPWPDRERRFVIHRKR